MRYEHRIIYEWPGELLKPWERRNPQFRSDWAATLQLLQRELEHIEAVDIVLESAHTEAELRLDGTLRGSAKQPAHPGVILSFESKYGPLRYWTDAFHTWQQNVRAIALGLEALRKLERYGITQRGQQYTGWAKLGPGTGQTVGVKELLTPQKARETIAELAGLHKAALLQADEETLHQMYRFAARKHHPDAAGGTANGEWTRLTEAAEVLGITK